MNDSNQQHQPLRGALDGRADWPRDFDFREAYAEQRELLAAAPCTEPTATAAKGAEGHE